MFHLVGTFAGFEARTENVDYSQLGRIVHPCQQRNAGMGGYVYCVLSGVARYCSQWDRPQVPGLAYPRATEVLDFVAFFAPSTFLPRGAR